MKKALVLGVLLLALGCAAHQADRLYMDGDTSAAVPSYEQYLIRRAELSADDAPIILKLAIALSDEEGEHYDASRSEHFLRLLVNLFPKTPEARQAAFALQSMDTIAMLQNSLRGRDNQIQALRAVLDSVVAAETRLRSEVETSEEEREGLESRIAVLTRSARRLSGELAELESELDALKRIDIETAGGVPSLGGEEDGERVDGSKAPDENPTQDPPKSSASDGP